MSFSFTDDELGDFFGRLTRLWKGRKWAMLWELNKEYVVSLLNVWKLNSTIVWKTGLYIIFLFQPYLLFPLFALHLLIGPVHTQRCRRADKLETTPIKLRVPLAEQSLCSQPFKANEELLWWGLYFLHSEYEPSCRSLFFFSLSLSPPQFPVSSFVCVLCLYTLLVWFRWGWWLMGCTAWCRGASLTSAK